MTQVAGARILGDAAPAKSDGKVTTSTPASDKVEKVKSKTDIDIDDAKIRGLLADLVQKEVKKQMDRLQPHKGMAIHGSKSNNKKLTQVSARDDSKPVYRFDGFYSSMEDCNAGKNPSMSVAFKQEIYCEEVSGSTAKWILEDVVNEDSPNKRDKVEDDEMYYMTAGCSVAAYHLKKGTCDDRSEDSFDVQFYGPGHE